MNKEIREHIEKATVVVNVNDDPGQGVLIAGGFILTAAHCVPWSCEGDMMLYDCFLQTIKTRDNKLLTVTPYAVEPVSDIAVLGKVDDQTYPREALAFEQFCEGTFPIPAFTEEMEIAKAMTVYLLSHKGAWIKGEVTHWGPSLGHCVCLHSQGIEGGTSGGPVVSEDGRLVGVVSNCEEPADEDVDEHDNSVPYLVRI